MDNATTWCTTQMEPGHCASRNVPKTVHGAVSTGQSRDRDRANIKLGTRTLSGMFQNASQTGYIV